ncbi:MAG: apiosidase-like domain-containing protein, partial [Candidatus Zipacnadales bacterium]
MLSTLCWGGLLMGALVGNAQAAGPLRVCEANPRYFADASGRAILLVGAHTWNNLQDIGESDPPPAFDWEAYLDFLTRHHHNFVRMWRWELTIWDTRPSQGNRHHFCAPHPWARTGPGLALDGKPKFDLTRYDETYFSRLRSRVESAGKRGIYVSIMLFEGWGLQFGENAWQAHPFNPQNNVNGIGSDPNGDGKGLEVHELVDPQMTAVQEAYVRKVIDTVNDLDNVLYEISNENHPASTEWQYHMIRFIHDYERRKPKQHPVGMTFQYKGGSNQTLFDSPAEWISPNPEGGYRDDPPAADGNKVVINDTDHLWGIGGNRQWVWKSFCRGLNPIFMDPYEGVVLPSDAKWESIRASLGHVLALSERLDLAKLTPQNTLASTGYCLAEPGREYVVYLPEGGEVKVDLSQAQGSLAVEWISGASGEVSVGPAIAGGSLRSLTCPLAGDAVLHLHRLDEAAPLQTREALQLLPSAPIPREFRLRVSENHRYLVDQDGRPWLWIGDTGWSLFHSLTAEEAEMYLENRRQKGFTLIQCILAHYWGSVPAHGIAETESPWLDNNPATPNPTFFEHVDRVLQIAQQKGLVLGLLPAWGDLVVSRKVLTTANARAYGKWLGTRYKDSPNIVWILGGDQPPTGFEDVYRELAAGLREGDGGRHLITYHPRGGQQSSTYFHEEPWLDLNMMQSGHVIDIPNYAMVLADYARTPVKPTLDGEPRYEHIINGLREEGPRISAHQVRKAAYNALLSGACGHTYGCSEIYRFWRPGDEGRWGPDTPWQAAMDFPGAFHIGYLKALLLSLPWHTLHPEPSLIAGQPGSGGTYMPAALSADRSRALIYVPETQVVPVNLARLSARKVRATWYNPRDGSFIPVGEFSGDSTPRFVAPAPDPDADYVLLLEATVPDTEPPTVQRVINVGNLTTLVIRFSEPVSPESAADLRNYRINDHINLTEATLGGDNQTVILRTSKMEEGKLYT